MRGIYISYIEQVALLVPLAFLKSLSLDRDDLSVDGLQQFPLPAEAYALDDLPAAFTICLLVVLEASWLCARFLSLSLSLEYLHPLKRRLLGESSVFLRVN